MYSRERVKDILSRVPLNPLSPGENELTLHFCISVFPHFFSLHSDILQQRVTVCMPGFSSSKVGEMQAINYSMLNAYALFNCYVIQCYQRSQNILVKY